MGPGRPCQVRGETAAALQSLQCCAGEIKEVDGKGERRRSSLAPSSGGGLTGAPALVTRYAVTAPRQRGAIAIGCVTPRAAVNAHDGWAPGVSGWIGRVMRAAGSSSAPTHAAGFILPPRESSLPAILAERPLGDTWEGETGCTAPRRVVIPSHRVAAFPVPTIVTVDADRGTLTVAIGNKEWTQHLDAADTGAPLAPCIAVELSGDVVAMHRFV
mmetsp:Transcript_32757/g.98953  ORF Transcript_32757/g.98953 Transcript_32757/m.98953 type:complete len:215 (+) Transcript_32757:975-1619(+)